MKNRFIYYLIKDEEINPLATNIRDNTDNSSAYSVPSPFSVRSTCVDTSDFLAALGRAVEKVASESGKTGLDGCYMMMIQIGTKQILTEKKVSLYKC